MKLKPFILIALLLAQMPIVLGDAPEITDITYTLVRELDDYRNLGINVHYLKETRIYEQDVLTEGHLPFIISYTATNDFSLNRGQIDKLVRTTILQSSQSAYENFTFTYQILQNETYQEKVPVYETEMLTDENGTLYESTTLVGYDNVKKFEWNWVNLNKYSPDLFDKNSFLVVDIIGHTRAGWTGGIDIAPVIDILNVNNTLTQWAWWNASWHYYKVLTICNKMACYASNLTVGKTSGGEVNCGGHCNDNFSDVRFVRENNLTLLPYYLENYTVGAQGTFWVNNTYNDTYILMYYGNPNCHNLSNGNTTFLFFDDFEDGNLNKWSSTHADFSIQPGGAHGGNYLEHDGTGYTATIKNWVARTNTTMFHCYAMCTDVTKDYYPMLSLDGAGNVYMSYFYQDKFNYLIGGGIDRPWGGIINDGQWYRFEVSWQLSPAIRQGWEDRVYQLAHQNLLTTGGATNSNDAYRILGSTNGYIMGVDLVIVRLFVNQSAPYFCAFSVEFNNLPPTMANPINITGYTPTNLTTDICPCDLVVSASFTHENGTGCNISFYFINSSYVEYMNVPGVNYTNVHNGTYYICLDLHLFNSTFNWYFNVTEESRPSVYNRSEIYQFTTTTNYSCCNSSGCVDTDTISSEVWLFGIILIFAIPGIIAYIRRRR